MRTLYDVEIHFRENKSYKFEQCESPEVADGVVVVRNRAIGKSWVYPLDLIAGIETTAVECDGPEVVCNGATGEMVTIHPRAK